MHTSNILKSVERTQAKQLIEVYKESKENRIKERELYLTDLTDLPQENPRYEFLRKSIEECNVLIEQYDRKIQSLL